MVLSVAWDSSQDGSVCPYVSRVGSHSRMPLSSPIASQIANLQDQYMYIDTIGDSNRTWPSWIQKCWQWFPATGLLEKRETALDEQISEKKSDPLCGEKSANFAKIRGKSSCKRAESDVFNWLQIRLHNNWLYTACSRNTTFLLCLLVSYGCVSQPPVHMIRNRAINSPHI